MSHEREYRVLIIDDNPQLLKAFTEGLPLVGAFVVATAEDGAQGLECLYHFHPDCVVIDVKMPELDGYQLVRVLRGDPETAQLPLIILTALAQDKDRFAGLASGADHYLNKPVKPSELGAAIRHACALGEDDRLRSMQDLAEGQP